MEIEACCLVLDKNLKMDFKNKVLFALTKRILEKNKRFHNIHFGETCYLFGNGASLKYVNFLKFSDKITIGCNYLALHKDFDKLDCRYYVLPEPFFSYPIFINPYNEKIEFNKLSKLFKEATKHQKSFLFTNLSNAAGFWKRDYFYFYHFGKKNSLEHYDLSSNFGYGKGALYSMLGLAIYMGFSEAVLLGCDNMYQGFYSGHFYSNKKTLYNPDSDTSNLYEFYKEFLEIGKKIKIKVIIDDGAKSKFFNYVEYSAFTGEIPVFRENYEIVEPAYLDILRKAYNLGQFQELID